MKYYKLRRFHSDIHVFEYNPNLNPSQIAFGVRGKHEKLSDIKHNWFKKNNYYEIAKVNFGFFNSSSEHLGLIFHDNGFMEGKPHHGVEAYLTKNNDFKVEQLPYDKAKNIYKNVSWGGSLSYALIINGEINLLGAEHYPHANSKQPRTWISQRASDKMMFLIVADGRSSWDKGLTAMEQAKISQELGLEFAANCDGGGSSSIMIHGKNGMKTVNSPSDGSERNIGSALIVFSKEPVDILGEYVKSKKENTVVAPPSQKNRKIKIALDAGHGSDTWERTKGKGRIYDNGKVFEEHDFNSDVLIYAKKLAEHNDFEVLLTQPPHSKEVPLMQRIDMANKENVDLYFSIHANASENPSASGACAFYWHTANEARKLATIWKNKMANTPVGLHGSGLHPSRPNSWTNLAVCRETNMTAVLVENGFFTNEHDLKYILSDDYRRLCAEIIVQSICEFYGRKFNPLPQENKKENNKNNKQQNDLDWQTKIGIQAVDYLAKEGYINDPETWYGKMRDSSENWMVFELFRRKIEGEK